MSILMEPRLFTIEDYYRMAAAGILTEDDRVELIEGQVVTMSPIGNRHSSCVARLPDELTRQCGNAILLWPQNPIVLDRFSEPQPDIVALQRRDDYYIHAKPRPKDTILVIEVADSSERFDRQIKAPLYAKKGVPELWIVCLESHRVEIFRDPTEQGYATVLSLAPGEVATTPALPQLRLLVSDLVGG